MPTALITGCNGFSGRHLIRRLKEEKDLRLIGSDIGETSVRENELDIYHHLDMLNREKLNQLVDRYTPDLIFNLSGLIDGPAVDIYKVNFLTGVYLLDAVRRYSPKSHIVIIGSSAEYGRVAGHVTPISEEQLCNPVSAYGISKYSLTMATQDYVRKFKLRAVIARPFNLIGAGMPPFLVVGAMIQRIKKAINNGDSYVSIGNTDTERDFIAVEDAVNAYLRMIYSGFWGEIFNICSGKGITIKSIVERLLKKAPHSIVMRIDPNLVRNGEIQVVIGSCEKARRLLGFSKRYSLEESLQAAWDHAMREG